ncbi:hypothetical protein C2E21_8192 [Chlorella sorokiniana]|uniref:Uncharacterized protein n=1 Tax=Chlorella sorokiniana TaxID=3076 RepID=A0A2P6TF37_CHLSO|nr:hypothetical protein C2E21_8192 [Chlorella sorokiniana]|eukprot:PRW32587.1 hypothetical protein C2E21_8192 [Chlorella sorokiniana]
MASALCFSVAPRTAAFAAQQQRRPARRLQPVRASAEDDQKGLDFTSNKRAALGFTENDSAGQTNIFAVEPKQYVAGSSSDKTGEGSQATLIVAGIAAVAAAAAVSGGLLANSSSPTSLSDLAPVEGVKSLTAYSQQFAAELAPAAPALSE